jgi:hypothetical protein
MNSAISLRPYSLNNTSFVVVSIALLMAHLDVTATRHPAAECRQALTDAGKSCLDVHHPVARLLPFITAFGCVNEGLQARQKPLIFKTAK